MADHFCVEHQQVWFKKGNMRRYAHPLKDASGNTTGWCNEPVQTNEPESEPQPKQNTWQDNRSEEIPDKLEIPINKQSWRKYKTVGATQ